MDDLRGISTLGFDEYDMLACFIEWAKKRNIDFSKRSTKDVIFEFHLDMMEAMSVAAKDQAAILNRQSLRVIGGGA